MLNVRCDPISPFPHFLLRKAARVFLFLAYNASYHEGQIFRLMDNLAQFESDLWEAADNLRANSKLTSSDYFMPVLGVIFLRHAANRFDAAHRQIVAD